MTLGAAAYAKSAGAAGAMAYKSTTGAMIYKGYQYLDLYSYSRDRIGDASVYTDGLIWEDEDTVMATAITNLHNENWGANFNKQPSQQTAKSKTGATLTRTRCIARATAYGYNTSTWNGWTCSIIRITIDNPLSLPLRIHAVISSGEPPSAWSDVYDNAQYSDSGTGTVDVSVNLTLGTYLVIMAMLDPYTAPVVADPPAPSYPSASLEETATVTQGITIKLTP
jgi:hypothetical protein